MKRNKNLWHRRKRCTRCNKGFDTYGGIKFLCFRIKKWEHKCKCIIKNYSISSIDEIYGVKTELDKEKCEQVKKQSNLDNAEFHSQMGECG